MADRINDIVLVHGGFVDGSGWASMEVPGSHAIYVSHPSAVAALIKTAATSPKFASV